MSSLTIEAALAARHVGSGMKSAAWSRGPILTIAAAALAARQVISEPSNNSIFRPDQISSLTISRRCWLLDT
jgi:hypothetical protein